MRAVIIPNWLSVDECRALMRRWNRAHAETGYIPDGAHPGRDQINRKEKYRLDHFVYAKGLNRMLERKFRLALLPLGFRGGWIEWFRIGCYGKGGHFRLHRDDTAEDIAGRTWSLVCVLADPKKYTGGALEFPELGLSLRMTAGTAAVFSAHLLHGVQPVKSGRRFALITFANSGKP